MFVFSLYLNFKNDRVIIKSHPRKIMRSVTNGAPPGKKFLGLPLSPMNLYKKKKKIGA